MSDLVTRAEVVKLARTLEMATAQVHCLEPLGAADLRLLRDQVSATLHDGDRTRFGRLAEAARILPAGIVARIVERVFGPLITARIAGLLPPAKAVAIVAQLPVMFLTDLAVAMDPRRAREVIAQIPTSTVVDVARELVQRGDHITVGRFIEVLTDEAVRALIAAIDDDEDLLRIGFYIEQPATLDRAIALLPPQRLRTLVHTAVSGSTEVRLASLSLLSRVSPEWKSRLGDLVAAQPEAALDGFVTTAVAEQASAELLTAIAAMSPASQATIAHVPAFADHKVLEDFANAARQRGLQAELASFSERMDQDAQRRLAKLS